MTKVKAEISVKGTKTLLFHTIPLDALSTKKMKGGTAGDDSSEWKKTVLMDAERRLYVYNTYFQSSICEAGKEIKVGKATIHKKLFSTVEVVEPKIFLDNLVVPEDKDLLRDDSLPIYLDVRAVVNPMTKGRNLRYRIAAKPGWTCTFHVVWDGRIVSKEHIRLCIELGGSLQGIGDGRKIGFGRYEMTNFEIQES